MTSDKKKDVLYLHGFASSGATGTATTLRHILYKDGIGVVAPDIPTDPLEALATLHALVERIDPAFIVATSMGCLYAEQMKGRRRILVNPSFHMARLLTFRGLGRHEFRNRREDGAKDFKVDKAMIAAFKEVEKGSFASITAEEKTLVWGLFGTKDKLVNCQADFKKHYGGAQMRLFEGEHFLSDKVLSKEVVPLLLRLAEP